MKVGKHSIHLLISDFVVARLGNIETYHRPDSSPDNGKPIPDNNDQGVRTPQADHVIDGQHSYGYFTLGCTSRFHCWPEHQPVGV